MILLSKQGDYKLSSIPEATEKSMDTISVTWSKFHTEDQKYFIYLCPYSYIILFIYVHIYIRHNCKIFNCYENMAPTGAPLVKTMYI
jgi:hypothetical protein